MVNFTCLMEKVLYWDMLLYHQAPADLKFKNSKGLAGPRVASWGCFHSPATSVLSTQLRSQKLVWAPRFLNGYGRVRLG